MIYTFKWPFLLGMEQTNHLSSGGAEAGSS